MYCICKAYYKELSIEVALNVDSLSAVHSSPIFIDIYCAYIAMACI